MDNRNRPKIKIDKKKETRTKEISKMINEGGLGADKYYNIKKKPAPEKEVSKNNENDKDE